MIVLDTNIITEMMRDDPDPVVKAWLDAQSPESVWLNVISVYETRYGLSCMSEGRRRRALEQAFESLLREAFAGRIAALDRAAADAAGRLAAQCSKAGRSIDPRHAMIGGIALARKSVLATRNTRHFQIGGIKLADPWAP